MNLIKEWKVNGSEDTTAIWVEGADGKRVCTVRNCEDDADHARLIAAAPALLAALTELHRLVEATDDIVETSDRYGIYHNDMMDALDAAEVAIKQARGE